MFISLCNATGGLSLPSHDTLVVLTVQSTFLERSFVYSNGLFCSRIFLLCASLKYDHILNILYNIINKIINNCIVLTARTAALSFFQNPALDRESNPHMIF
jgi:hypothetical protein